MALGICIDKAHLVTLWQATCIHAEVNVKKGISRSFNCFMAQVLVHCGIVIWQDDVDIVVKCDSEHFHVWSVCIALSLGHN